MSIAQAVLPEFDNEMATTRRLIERAPVDRGDWKPHPKSYSLGELITHLANLPRWAVMTIEETELDLNPPGGPPWTPPQYEGVARTLETFDANVAAARAALEKASDEDYMVTWALKNAGETIMALPRVVCIRSFVLNHVIHHRGQLSVYLRLNDVPLPQIYGPTADEPM